MKKLYVSIALLLVMCVLISGCSFIPFELPSLSDREETAEFTETQPETQTETTAEIEPDYTLYKPYMQEVLNNLPDDKYARAVGVLCDVGLNGVDELIMMYDSDTVKHPDNDMVGMAVAYSVYTIDGDKVVEIAKDHFLFPLAGGPSGVAYVLEGYEENLLGFRYMEVNPGDNDMCCMGNWYIYSVDGPHNDVPNHFDEFPQEVEYFYHCDMGDDYENIDYSKENYAKSKSDDRAGTYDWFHKWLSENRPTEILRYGLDNEEQSLENLMNSL